MNILNLELIFVAVLGLCLGSFCNVVCYRLPQMIQSAWAQACAEFVKEHARSVDLTNLVTNINLATPASHCLHCKQAIKFYDNIPLLSYCILGGKCRSCKSPISLQYPLIELISTLIAVGAYLYFSPLSMTIWVACFFYIMLLQSVIDFNHLIIPDELTYTGIWLGLLANLSGFFIEIDSAIYGCIAGYLSLWGIYWLFYLITGKEGMGHGDFKLFAMFGAWLGWQQLPLIIVIASLVGSIVGISIILIKKGTPEKPIPFGPFLCLGASIALLWSEPIYRFYFSYLGINV